MDGGAGDRHAATTTRASTRSARRRRRAVPGRADESSTSSTPASRPCDDLSEALVAVYGTDYGLRSATWISRFTDMTRQAASYREGRVLLAGDAAHVHSPTAARGSTPACRMR